MLAYTVTGSVGLRAGCALLMQTGVGPGPGITRCHLCHPLPAPTAGSIPVDSTLHSVFRTASDLLFQRTVSYAYRV